jgi:hypothetical protein
MSLFRCLVCATVFAFVAAIASAQTVGSTTGAINGTVTDSSSAIIPGVTVTLSGSAVMGAPSTVTDQNGFFRFPALTPGDYNVTFELTGFGTVKHEGIRVSIGFTATVNAELNPAGVAENVTVSGASPVVDLQATNVTTHYDSEKLANLPGGARDFWSTIMATVPAVAMNRVDVGGNSALVVQTSREYGTAGQARSLVEGMSVTYSTSSPFGLYGDYAAYGEVSMTAAGNTAEMPSGGMLAQLISKSGGNTYHGTIYTDFQHKNLGGRNIDDAQVALGLQGGGGISVYDLNRLDRFQDFNADVGGYLIKDKLWWYGAYRYTLLDLRTPNLVGKAQRSTDNVVTGKGTYQASAKHKFIGFMTQALPVSRDYLQSALLGVGQTARGIWSPESVYRKTLYAGTWKGEYDAVLSSAMLLEVRAGNFYYDFDRTALSTEPRYEDIGNSLIRGGNAPTNTSIRRPQLNGSLSYLKTGWGGEHNFKFGGEVTRDAEQDPFQAYPGNILHVLNNGAANQVYLYTSPSLSKSGMRTTSFFANDTWKASNRLSLNLGLRLDRYRSFLPEQQGPAGQAYAAVDNLITWNNWGPRLGVTYDLAGSGKTVLKFNTGQYWHWPFTELANNANANSTQWYQQYTWTDSNTNGRFDDGEQGRLVAARGGTASAGLDPNLKNQFTREALVYVEHELAANFGIRSGITWRGRRNAYATVNVNRPYDAFTVPTTVLDPGRDGTGGNADDGGAIPAYNLAAAYTSLPVRNLVQNVPNADSNYYTWETTATKRSTSWWSLVGSFAKTWSRRSVTPVTPNDLIFREDGRDVFTDWQAKVNGTLELPGQLRVSPMMRHQSGTAYGRTFVATLNYANPTLLAEPVGTRRTPNVTVFDVRTEKGFRWNTRRVALFLDLYNIANTNAEQVVVMSSGTSFLRPVYITGPRIARVGAKFEW